MSDPIAVDGVLDIEPHFLIEHEQYQVVQKWRQVSGTKAVVTASSYEDGIVAGKETHCVAEPRCGRLPLALNLHKLSVHHFTVNNDRLEVAELVLELSLLVLPSEEVDTVLNQVALSADNLIIRVSISLILA